MSDKEELEEIYGFEVFHSLIIKYSVNNHNWCFSRQNISISDDILSVLDSQGIAPSRFVDSDDDDVVEEPKKDENVFPTLKKKSQQ